MIIKFALGRHLLDVLKDPTKPNAERDYLDPNIDDQKLDFIYNQLANMTLQILGLHFIRIGAIFKESESNTWSVTGRPLTSSMNELAICAEYTIDQLASGTFKQESNYFMSLASKKLIHLRTQRNIAKSLIHRPSLIREVGPTVPPTAKIRTAPLSSFATTCDPNPFS
jgi:hypothetical protein